MQILGLTQKSATNKNERAEGARGLPALYYTTCCHPLSIGKLHKDLTKPDPEICALFLSKRVDKPIPMRYNCIIKRKGATKQSRVGRRAPRRLLI